MKRILLLSIALISTFFNTAQNTISQLDILKAKFPHASHEKCKAAVLHKNLLLEDAEYAARISANEQLIKDYLNSPQLKSGGVYTIPVVVHVMHLGEAVGAGTNISDAQIQSAINNLNDAYRNVGYNGIDIGIEFVLAKRDEDCNASTGINRVDASGVSDYATNGITNDDGSSENEVAVKALSKWSNISYYNIWVVSEIDGNDGGAGTQGYAYFPGASASRDGTVVLYNSFGYDPTGTIGYNLKSYTNHNATTIHELGHGLDLYHTFQGDDDGNICPVDTDPNEDGDKCADTDAHNRNDSNCSGTIENTCHGVVGSTVYNNFMAYSSDECQDRFTSNQKDRMLAALLTTRVGLTNSLGATAPSGSGPIAATCSPDYTTPNNFGMGVTGFELNTINVLSGTSQQENGYQDRTCHFKTSVQSGSSHSINVSVGPANNQDVEVWIDYNNDGDFEDANENVFSGSNDTIFNGSITVPSSGVTLNTNLRVRVIADWANNNISGPCYNPIYGEVEEYSVMVMAASGTPPLADFSVSNQTPCAGTSVSFTDLSTETPTAWSWNFGDGFVSSSQNPSHTYANPGNYTVTLTATNAAGSDDEVKTAFITVLAPEDASYSYSNASYCTVDADPTPTITGTGGGSFTATPVGLSLNGGTGEIDVSSSTIGIYTITYETPGTCSVQNNDVVEIESCSNVDDTKLRVQDCGRTLVSIYDKFYADEVTGATDYQFEFEDAANPGINVFEYTRNRRYINFNQVGVSYYLYNTTFNVRVRAKVGGVWGDYATICQLNTQATISTTKLRVQDCGRSLVSVYDKFYADEVTGATDYQFEFEDVANPGVNVFEFARNRRYVNFNQIGVSNYLYNTTFNVRVRAKVGGVWGNYASVCQLSTESTIADTELRAQDCGKTLNSIYDKFYADDVFGATDYQFEFEDAANPGVNVFNYSRDRRYINFNQVGSVYFIPGVIYNVTVRAKIGGTWGSYGNTCQLIIGSSAINPSDDIVSKSFNIGVSSTNIVKDVNVYPNPAKDMFTIEFNDVTQEGDIQLMNSVGQLVHQESINSNRTEVYVNDLPRGVYFLRISDISGEVISKKVIIE